VPPASVTRTLQGAPTRDLRDPIDPIDPIDPCDH
jgi:hypothetical protein